MHQIQTSLVFKFTIQCFDTGLRNIRLSWSWYCMVKTACKQYLVAMFSNHTYDNMLILHLLEKMSWDAMQFLAHYDENSSWNDLVLHRNARTINGWNWRAIVTSRHLWSASFFFFLQRSENCKSPSLKAGAITFWRTTLGKNWNWKKHVKFISAIVYWKSQVISRSQARHTCSKARTYQLKKNNLEAWSGPSKYGASDHICRHIGM